MFSRGTSATVAATAATSSLLIVSSMLWWNKRQSESKRGMDNEDIPPELRMSNCQYEAQLKLAIQLAKEAGGNMKNYYDTVGTTSQVSLEIDTKGQPEDFCTAIDVLNEELIEKGILAEFPEHKIIGEESTGTGSIPKLTNEPTWILDPIDGTTNFASGNALTCVSIGYCEGGKPVMGVVYAPMLDELYVGIRGYGAYRNGERIEATKKKSVNLSEAIAVFEFGYTRSEEGIAKMVGGVQRILNHGCRALRGYGSGVLDLCHVARGSIDVVYAGLAGEGWKPWDYCAGMVIALESGCCIESLFPKGGKEKGEFDLYSQSVICAVNRDLLNTCRNVVCEGL